MNPFYHVMCFSCLYMSKIHYLLIYFSKLHTFLQYDIPKTQVKNTQSLQRCHHFITPHFSQRSLFLCGNKNTYTKASSPRTTFICYEMEFLFLRLIQQGFIRHCAECCGRCRQRSHVSFSPKHVYHLGWGWGCEISEYTKKNKKSIWSNRDSVCCTLEPIHLVTNLKPSKGI